MATNQSPRAACACANGGGMCAYHAHYVADAMEIPSRPCLCDRVKGTQCRLHGTLTDLLMEGAWSDAD